jgi:RHS repeat-associated protein
MSRKTGRLKVLVLLLGVPHLVNASPMWSEETHEIAFGDFNADNRSDMLYIAKDAAQSSGIVLSTSAGGTLADANQTWPSNHLGIPWHSGTYKPVIADFNNDGRDDIFLQRQSAGDHYLLLASGLGQFTAIKQTLPNNTGGQLWSANEHRLVAGDFNGDGKADLFLQAVRPSGVHALFLCDASTSTFTSAQQTWGDGKFDFAWSLSRANVFAGEFTGDNKDDLLVQGKPDIVIIDFDVPFPVPHYRPDSFGIMQAKPLSNNDIFYLPVYDYWDRFERGGDWSGVHYRAVVADFNGDGRSDVFLQGRTQAHQNRLMITGSNGQMTSTNVLADATLQAFSSAQGRIHAGNFDGTGAAGLYLQASTSAGTNQYVENATTSTAVLVNHHSPSVSTPPAQVYQAFTTATRYNAGGQVTGTISPDPDGGGPLHYAAVRNTYDSAGRLIRVETGELSSWFNENTQPKDWSGFTVFSSIELTPDQYGRVIKKVAKGSDGVAFAATQQNYNPIGQPLCKAVRMNPSAFASLPSNACELGAQGAYGPDRITKTEFNLWDQLLTETRAVGTSLEQIHVINTYNERLLETQTDANGNMTEYSYTNYRRLWKRWYPSKTDKGNVNASDYNEYTYDANGNVLTDRKRNGDVITYTYDTMNRPTFKNLSDNTHSPDVAMDYDLRGLLRHSRFTDDAGPGIINTYDGFGRLKTDTNNLSGTNRVLTYEYDRNGNRKRITHPDGNYFTYEFDDLNRMVEIKESGSTSLLKVGYYPNGRRRGIARLNGSGAATNYHFDATQRLDDFNQDFDLAGTSNDLTNSFSYNPKSQIEELTQSNNQYSYTGANDRTGNYVSNGLNQYSTIGAQSVVYDTNGNLTSDNGWSATYDMENHLVATTQPANGSLKYDPLGRLSEYTVPAGTTQFVYSGDSLVLEYNGSGGSATLTQRYVHGDQVDEPLVGYVGTTLTSRKFFHADHQGSVIAHSGNTAAVVQVNAFDAYGIPKIGNDGRFGFTGQGWLKELGINYYKARVYSPKLGRFLQTDPIFYSDDLNIYAYVGQDPFNRTDPTGMCNLLCPPSVPAYGQLIEQATSRYQTRAQADSYQAGASTRMIDSILSVAGQNAREVAADAIERTAERARVNFVAAGQVEGLGRFDFQGTVDLAGNVSASGQFGTPVHGAKPLDVGVEGQVTVYGDPRQQDLVTTSVSVGPVNVDVGTSSEGNAKVDVGYQLGLKSAPVAVAVSTEKEVDVCVTGTCPN